MIQQIKQYRPNWGTVASIILVCAAVTYLNQRDALKGALGNWTSLLDFAAGLLMLANSQLKEIFSKTAVTEVVEEKVSDAQGGVR